jgi:hypothetical protein
MPHLQSCRQCRASSAYVRSSGLEPSLLRAQFSEKELVDLTMAVITINGLEPSLDKLRHRSGQLSAISICGCSTLARC